MSYGIKGVDVSLCHYITYYRNSNKSKNTNLIHIHGNECLRQHQPEGEVAEAAERQPHADADHSEVGQQIQVEHVRYCSPGNWK